MGECGACTVLLDGDPGQRLPDSGLESERQGRRHRGRARHRGKPPPRATIFHGNRGRAMRILHPRNDHGRSRPAQARTEPDGRSDQGRPLPGTSAAAPATAISSKPCGGAGAKVRGRAMKTGYISPKDLKSSLRRCSPKAEEKIVAGGHRPDGSIAKGRTGRIGHAPNVPGRLRHSRIEPDRFGRRPAVSGERRSPSALSKRTSASSNVSPALAKAASTVGSVQIRNLATIGGNIANASPAADGLTVLAAYGAKAHVASVRGTRCLTLEELITGPNKTVLEPDELILGFQWDGSFDPKGQLFVKVGRRKAHGHRPAERGRLPGQGPERPPCGARSLLPVASKADRNRSDGPFGTARNRLLPGSREDGGRHVRTCLAAGGLPLRTKCLRYRESSHAPWKRHGPE